jgi:hypothetical protein
MARFLVYNVMMFIIGRMRNNNIKDLGVPKFLVNKWLNIKQDKSRFVDPNCQVDNKDDVSSYSETTLSKLSSPRVRIRRGKLHSKFSNKNVGISSLNEKRSRAMSQFNIEENISSKEIH